jgi:hypothetical protein
MKNWNFFGRFLCDFVLGEKPKKKEREKKTASPS